MPGWAGGRRLEGDVEREQRPSHRQMADDVLAAIEGQVSILGGEAEPSGPVTDPGRDLPGEVGAALGNRTGICVSLNASR